MTATTPFKFRRIARVTIELTTPLHLGNGLPGEVTDAGVATDANGLPAVPGSSLAGSLRSALRERSGAQAAADIFGDSLSDKEANRARKESGLPSRSSRISVSWACIHDADDRPVEGIATEADEVLLAAREPTLRDHVRIDSRGAAEERGKFDELAVHAGHRFTFEMELVATADDPDDEESWNALLGILCSGDLRIGGKSRRGFGAFKPVRIAQAVFDLSDPEGFTAYRDHPVSLTASADGLSERELDPASSSAPFATLRLKPRGLWMFGGGADVAENTRGVDLAPVRDTRIVWTEDKAEVIADVVYLPGSSVKGALSHRIAYHYNRIAGIFAKTDEHPDGVEDPSLASGPENNPAVKLLFGYVKTKEEKGLRGRVLIDDVYLSPEVPDLRVPHVKIDGFTGGAFPGALFDERPLLGLPPEIPAMEISVRLLETEAILKEAEGPRALEALKAALEDLSTGDLPLGGGVNRGLGAMDGEIKFSEAA